LILPELAKLLNSRVKFRIIGDGGQRKKLEHAIAELSLNNVELIAPVARDRLIEEYIKADVLFLHLNDYPAFKKVLPSKLFEYAAMGKPIWAGLNGYSAHFVRSEIVGCKVFLPGDIADAIDKFDALELNVEPRVEFNQKFNRDNIMNQMVLDILRFTKDNA
jgi:glycosyltransferase involved in cell wall biosynthesis